MKKFRLPVVAMAAFLLSAPLQAQKSKGGWVDLFNGKDLTGWKQLNGQAKYEVKDGAIVGTSVMGTPNSFLTTEKDYGDFILEQFDGLLGKRDGVLETELGYSDLQLVETRLYEWPRAWLSGRDRP